MWNILIDQNYAKLHNTFKEVTEKANKKIRQPKDTF